MLCLTALGESAKCAEQIGPKKLLCVVAPPCILHRPFRMAGDWQLVPRRVFAPHLARSRRRITRRVAVSQPTAPQRRRISAEGFFRVTFSRAGRESHLKLLKRLAVHGVCHIPNQFTYQTHHGLHDAGSCALQTLRCCPDDTGLSVHNIPGDIPMP